MCCLACFSSLLLLCNWFCFCSLQDGQFLLCQPESLVYDPVIYQASANGAIITGFDISSTFQAIAFADSAGIQPTRATSTVTL